MSARSLKVSVADADTTHSKLRMRQQAHCYNRGIRDLDSLEKGNAFEPRHIG